MTPPVPGRLIAVTGIDGAGKSTLTAALRQALTRRGEAVVAIGKHTVDGPGDPRLARYLAAVNAVVYGERPDNGHECGDLYWLLALAAWYALQDRLVVRPALDAGATVLLDNTHHKILARYGANPAVRTALAEQVFADLTPADTVLHLHVDPTEALARKQVFTPLETGRSGADPQHFVAYQDAVTDELTRLSHACGWTRIDVTAKAPDTVLAEALSLLDERATHPAPTSAQ